MNAKKKITAHVRLCEHINLGKKIYCPISVEILKNLKELPYNYYILANVYVTTVFNACDGMWGGDIYS